MKVLWTLWAQDEDSRFPRYGCSDWYGVFVLVIIIIGFVQYDGTVLPLEPIFAPHQYCPCC